MQVINGTLHIHDCRLERDWKETIANTKMVVLEALRHFGQDSIPSVDIVVNQWDDDLVLLENWHTVAISNVTRRFAKAPLPIFSPARRPGMSVDIPFPGEGSNLDSRLGLCWACDS